MDQFIEDFADTLRFQAIMYYMLGKGVIDTVKEKVFGCEPDQAPNDWRNDDDRKRDEQRYR